MSCGASAWGAVKRKAARSDGPRTRAQLGLSFRLPPFGKQPLKNAPINTRARVSVHVGQETENPRYQLRFIQDT